MRKYPSIAENARQEGAEIHWGDQTGLRSDDVNGRGHSPAGKTPVRRAKGTPEKINMIGSVTNRGKVRFMFYGGSLNVRVFLDFLRRLIHDAGKRKVYLRAETRQKGRLAKSALSQMRSIQKQPSRVTKYFLSGAHPLCTVIGCRSSSCTRKSSLGFIISQV
jgi:hypothetical protein